MRFSDSVAIGWRSGVFALAVLCLLPGFVLGLKTRRAAREIVVLTAAGK